ncbi:MAG: phage head closure protein [Rhizobiales bacterium]|nr:phage head closure protein [Hyphomicrobiales bacterium]NRB13390.1 phage head closure protein [Hyphomicrobiales bacterium]
MSFRKTKFGVDFGELTQRIDIYNIVVSRDAIGGEVSAKTLWKTCWARLEPQQSEDRFSNQATKHLQKYRFYLRYQVEIKPQMQIEHAGDSYEILSVLDIDAKNEWLKISAVKLG